VGKELIKRNCRAAGGEELAIAPPPPTRRCPSPVSDVLWHYIPPQEPSRRYLLTVYTRVYAPIQAAAVPSRHMSTRPSMICMHAETPTPNQHGLNHADPQNAALAPASPSWQYAVCPGTIPEQAYNSVGGWCSRGGVQDSVGR
jgi:hypothetical protein